MGAPLSFALRRRASTLAASIVPQLPPELSLAPLSAAVAHATSTSTITRDEPTMENGGVDNTAHASRTLAAIWYFFSIVIAKQGHRRGYPSSTPDSFMTTTATITCNDPHAMAVRIKANSKMDVQTTLFIFLQVVSKISGASFHPTSYVFATKNLSPACGQRPKIT
jgi:hypothetical protein